MVPHLARIAYICDTTTIMDPFTAGSTVVGFIAGILDIAEVIAEYIRNTVGANEEKEALLSEIDATNNLLKDLERKAKAPEWKSTRSSMEKLDGPLQRYRSALEAGQEKLRPAKTSVGKVAKQAVWHFQKGEFAEILLKISRSKSDFAILLTLYSKTLLVWVLTAAISAKIYQLKWKIISSRLCRGSMVCNFRSGRS